MGKNKKQYHEKIERNDYVEIDGTVIEVLPQTFFKVQCGKSVVLANLAGKLRQNKIRILEGDRVRLQCSIYDMSRGRVCYRY